MSQHKYVVTLSTQQQEVLQDMVGAVHAAARQITHARILLKADRSQGDPHWTDGQRAQALEVSRKTVIRVKQGYAQQGLADALPRRMASTPRPRKLDGQQEAHLIALACSASPAGQARWTLRLLAGQLVELGYVQDVSHETVRQVLKKRTQAVVEAILVHSPKRQCRLRL